MSTYWGPSAPRPDRLLLRAAIRGVRGDCAEGHTHLLPIFLLELLLENKCLAFLKTSLNYVSLKFALYIETRFDPFLRAAEIVRPFVDWKGVVVLVG